MARKNNRPPRDLYQEITDRVIAALENGDLAPWQKPWQTFGVPRNGATGRPYRGVNVLLTLLTQWNRGYDHPLWLTFKQANEVAAKAMRKAGHKVEQNGHGTWVFADGENKGKSVGGVSKGQNKANDAGATDVIFWKPMRKTERDDAGEERTYTWMLMRSYAVFNVAQCDPHVVEYLTANLEERPEFSPIAEAERVCEAYEVETEHGGDRACYDPKADKIRLPNPEAFDSPEHYYTTRFHEMGHSTGHASRLNRDGIADFDFRGSHKYAEEELVAEFAACFVAGEVGILRTTEKNAASYLKHWAAKLAEDKKIIVRAAQRGQKAADLILGVQAAGDEESDGEAAKAA